MMKRLCRPVALALACVAALALGACSSFEREWRQAGEAGRGAEPFGGAWEGRWTSAKHRTSSGPAGGRLRCIFTRIDDAHYHARFRANWLAFTSTYATTFATERRAGELRFRGEHDLGPLYGGVYRYEGCIAPDRFTSTYHSSYDHGSYEMARVPAGPSLQTAQQR